MKIKSLKLNAAVGNELDEVSGLAFEEGAELVEDVPVEALLSVEVPDPAGLSPVDIHLLVEVVRSGDALVPQHTLNFDDYRHAGADYSTAKTIKIDVLVAGLLLSGGKFTGANKATLLHVFLNGGTFSHTANCPTQSQSPHNRHTFTTPPSRSLGAASSAINYQHRLRQCRNEELDKREHGGWTSAHFAFAVCAGGFDGGTSRAGRGLLWSERPGSDLTGYGRERENGHQHDRRAKSVENSHVSLRVSSKARARTETYYSHNAPYAIGVA